MARIMELATRNTGSTGNSPGVGEGHNRDSGRFRLRAPRHDLAPEHGAGARGIAAQAGVADAAQSFGGNMALAPYGVATPVSCSRSDTALDTAALRDRPGSGTALSRLG